MSVEFYKCLRKNIDAQKNIRKLRIELSNLKKRKIETIEQIDEKKQHMGLDFCEFAYVYANDINNDDLKIIQRHLWACKEILSCTIEAGDIVEDWGWIINSDQEISYGDHEYYGVKPEKDGEYYIFLDDRYRIYYLIYTDAEKMDTVLSRLWKKYTPLVETGDFPPCDEYYNCYYRLAPERVKMWETSYKFPELFIFNEEITLCDVCKSNGRKNAAIDECKRELHNAYKKHELEFRPVRHYSSY